MTNAKKYLKDDVNLEEFAKSIVGRFFGEDSFSANDYIRIKNWSEENTKPTLSEDERVILRNMPKQIKKIRRDKYKVKEPDMNYGMLEMVEEDDKYWTAPVLSHLFQFINEGEEYSIEELLK